jgi:HK97 family phage portal protein
MGVISRLSRILNLELRSTDIRDPRFWATELFGGGATRSGTYVSPDTAMRVSTVFACVSLLSSVLASLPLQLYKRRKSGGQDLATDHPLYDLVYIQPNAHQSSYEWREMEQSHLCLRGNAYSYKEMSGDGVVQNLIPLNPNRINPQVENGILYYYYSADANDPNYNSLPNGIYKWPSNWVMHLRALSTDGLMGLSPITAGREAIGLASGMEQFGAEGFGRKPVPGLVVSHNKTLSPDARKNLRESINSFATDRRLTAMVLEEGMTAENIGLSNSDSQYLDARGFQVEDICRFFNVPPYLIHAMHDKSATFASAGVVTLNFVIFSLVAPWVSRWESIMGRSLLNDRERSKYFFKFNVNALLRGDYKSRMAGYAQGRQWGIYSPNDIRELEDLNPRPGGDSYIDNPKNITGNDPTPPKQDTTPVKQEGQATPATPPAPKGGNE